MSARLRRHWNWIQTFLGDSLSSRQRTHLLRRATRDQVLAVGEIVANFLHGTFDIASKDRQKLIRYKDAYRRLAKPKGQLPWAERRTLLVKYSKPLVILLQVLTKDLKELLQ